MVSGMIALAVAGASLPGSYDCTIERQVVITEHGAEASTVSFPEAERDAWGFRATVPRDESTSTIEWPADPIQIAGRHQARRLAPGQVAVVAPSDGPCMFTEQECVAIVAFSAREDGTLAFSILPAGSVRNENGTRSIFHVVFVGTCRRRGGA